MSLPYPEPGIRLIRQQKIDQFAEKMKEFQEELTEAVQALDRQYYDLKAIARQRLGSCTTVATIPLRSTAFSRSASISPPWRLRIQA